MILSTPPSTVCGVCKNVDFASVCDFCAGKDSTVHANAKSSHETPRLAPSSRFFCSSSQNGSSKSVESLCSHVSEYFNP